MKRGRSRVAITVVSSDRSHHGSKGGLKKLRVAARDGIIVASRRRGIIILAGSVFLDFQRDGGDDADDDGAERTGAWKRIMATEFVSVVNKVEYHYQGTTKGAGKTACRPVARLTAISLTRQGELDCD